MGPSRAVTRRAAGKNAGFHPRSTRSGGGGGYTGPALRRPRDRVAHSLCALTRRGDPAVTWRQLGIARNFRRMNSYRATFSARESRRISGGWQRGEVYACQGGGDPRGACNLRRFPRDARLPPARIILPRTDVAVIQILGGGELKYELPSRRAAKKTPLGGKRGGSTSAIAQVRDGRRRCRRSFRAIRVKWEE